MAVLSALIVGGLIGWLARMLAAGSAGLNMVMSVLVGAAGAFVATQFVAPLLGISLGDQDRFSLMAVMLAVAGAVGLVTLIDFARRVLAR